MKLEYRTLRATISHRHHYPRLTRPDRAVRQESASRSTLVRSGAVFDSSGLNASFCGKSVFSMKRIAYLAVLAMAIVTDAQQRPAPRQHWQLTDRETIWMGRYSNCQYGYYVLLPAGTVAHAELPPSPHHGFLISLPDVGSKSEATVHTSNPFIWVNGEYNVTNMPTLAAVTDYHIDLTRENKQNFKLLQRSRTRLQSEPAIRFKGEYDTAKGRMIEEEVIALRSGVVYEVGIRTPAIDYDSSRGRLGLTLTEFRFSQLPKGQCWNH
jgi:hypothetical protein